MHSEPIPIYFVHGHGYLLRMLHEFRVRTHANSGHAYWARSDIIKEEHGAPGA
jgi:hypothetical protein